MQQTFLKRVTHSRQPLRTASLVCLSFLCASTSFAEVKSLTSSELTETYIEDSTIIITPKRSQKLSEQKTISSVTIAPYQGDNVDADLVQETDEGQESIKGVIELDDELLRNSTVAAAFEPEIIIDIPTYQELITPDVADILGDERYRAPEGNFDFEYLGNDLALSREGDQLKFSIGNLPGIDTINIPESVTDGPVQIEPRPGGGFDLTINVPQDQ